MNLNPIIKVPVAELKNNLVGLAKVVNRRSTLPILGTIHVERDRTGWVHLSATDLDCFATYRLEAPGQHGSPAKCLVPLAELQKLSKCCPADEILELEPVSPDKLILRHRIGNHPVEQVFSTDAVGEFPGTPEVSATGANLSENDRTTLLNALQCVSDDETRFILTGIYLDVSKPESHYVVATNGRHLFASNSVHLPMKSSVIVPVHRFLSWGGFGKDGQWQLSCKEQKKEEAGYLKLESRRWTFVTKLIEGNYPNWRQITAQDEQKRSGSLEFSDSAIEAVQRIVPRLPGEGFENHTVGLFSTRQHLYLRGWNKDDIDATEIEVPGVKITGDPATVYLNREYLLKALGFGLRHIQVQEPLQPLRFSDGSRQMIVMPVRVDAFPSTRKIDVVAASPTAAIPIPVRAANDAQPDQPTTINPNNQPAERNQEPMQNGTSHNGNGHQPPATDSSSTPAAVEKSSVEQALEQIEVMKGTIRGVVGSLNGLADTLRQVQRDRRSSEREIRSVRDTLKTLQNVCL